MYRLVCRACGAGLCEETEGKVIELARLHSELRRHWGSVVVWRIGESTAGRPRVVSAWGTAPYLGRIERNKLTGLGRWV